MAVGSTINWSPQVKELNLFSLPFLMPDYAAIDALTQGSVGQKIFATLDKSGVVPLGWGENGFRELSNSKRPIKSPADLKGMKIRVVGSPIYSDMFTAMGANPTQMSWADAQPALSSGAVDGQENPLATIFGAKLFEVQKHLTLTGHQYNPQSVVISKKFWDGLSASEKKIVSDAVAESAKFQRTTARALEAGTLETLKKNGMEVTTLPASEMAILREKMKPVIVKHGEAISATVAELQAELAKLCK
jgi:tripartite ATP-independent transporter DctP family solute receptor